MRFGRFFQRFREIYDQNKVAHHEFPHFFIYNVNENKRDGTRRNLIIAIIFQFLNFNHFFLSNSKYLPFDKGWSFCHFYEKCHTTSVDWVFFFVHFLVSAKESSIGLFSPLWKYCFGCYEFGPSFPWNVSALWYWYYITYP